MEGEEWLTDWLTCSAYIHTVSCLKLCCSLGIAKGAYDSAEIDWTWLTNGHFDRAQLLLRTLLVLSIESEFVKEVYIFQERYCGSLNVNWLQSYKLSKLVDDPIVQESTLGHLDSGWVAEFFSNIQIWQLITLQPVELQRPTVPLWKDLNLFNIQLHNFNLEV